MEEMKNESLEKIKEMNEMKKTNDIEKEVPFNFSDEIKEEPKSVKKEINKKTRKKVDLSNIIITERDALVKEKDIKAAIFGSKSAFQICAAQSGYVAKITPLVNKDIVSMLYSNLSRYEYRKTLFRVIYGKISEFSVGDMSFTEWLHYTSVEDIETFYYGLYCATFPDEGKLTLNCPSCGSEATITVNHNNLFKTTNKTEMKKLITDVSANSKSRDDMMKYSLIGKNEAFQLPDSGIIAELRTPCLYDSLEILRTTPDEIIDRDMTSLTNMLYVNRFLIPVVDRPGAYSEQTDRREVLNIIENLSIDDATELQDAVSSRVDEHRITYSVKKFKCQNPECGVITDEIPISIEDILFTLIFEKTQR